MDQLIQSRAGQGGAGPDSPQLCLYLAKDPPSSPASPFTHRASVANALTAQYHPRRAFGSAMETICHDRRYASESEPDTVE